MNDYDIGFGKPPKESQFKPGRSGNPKGRQKKIKNITGDLYAVLNEKVLIKDGRGSRKITKLQAYLLQLANKAASGDLKAGKELMRLHQAVDVGHLEEVIKAPKIIVQFV